MTHQSFWKPIPYNINLEILVEKIKTVYFSGEICWIEFWSRASPYQANRNSAKQNFRSRAFDLTLDEKSIPLWKIIT